MTGDSAFDDRTHGLLKEWERRSVANQFGHLEAAKHFRKKNIWFGVPVIVLSAVVSTSIFASLNQEDVTPWVRLIIGLVSVAAAVLSALQTFLAFSEQASAHKVTGASYGAIGRRLEQAIKAGHFSEASTGEFLDDVRCELDQLAKEAPTLPDHIYRRVMQEFELEHPRVH
jgi:hypothetical protein